ncbi:MAG: Ribulose-phosphate 3-epimerase [candidate division TM6 bacterium GW2011_GWF2_37_49]|nr:MAG: Ribulose-phosphate 3-epimerase [candidate division TM6 bacterium GW2011_GWF2_37_49]
MQIFPSIICSDILNLQKTLQTLDSVCDGYHIDVMDDHFVPNLTIGPDFVNAITRKTALPSHVHLMVDNPKNWCDRLNLKKIDTLTFHIEAVSSYDELLDLVDKIRNKGWKKGLALNPNTPPPEYPVLQCFDQIIIMSVNPGFSGQKFIPEVVEKIKNLVNIKKRYFSDLQIAVDGGIDKQNMKMLIDLGVDVFCVGSAVFAAQDPRQALEELYNL